MKEAPKREWIIEKHLYLMPDDLEMFLAALSAIQDYTLWVAGRLCRLEMYVYCETVFDFLLPAFKCRETVLSVTKVHDIDSANREWFDHVVKFDGAVAKQMAALTDKHAAQMFGIILGSEPQRICPDLSEVSKAKPEYDILILPFPDEQRLYDFLSNNYPALAVNCYGRKEGQWLNGLYKPTLAHWRIAELPRMVIGLRSGLTYLSACFGRGVLEIYPPDCSRNWLSKWSHPFYQMIYAEPQQVKAELVYRAAEVLWKKVERSTLKIEVAV